MIMDSNCYYMYRPLLSLCRCILCNAYSFRYTIFLEYDDNLGCIGVNGEQYRDSV